MEGVHRMTPTKIVISVSVLVVFSMTMLSSTEAQVMRALSYYGIQPDSVRRTLVDTVVTGDTSVAIAGIGGHASAGLLGLAVAGFNARGDNPVSSYAIVGEIGVAITGYNGIDTIGDYSIGIAGRGGKVFGGAGGVAIVGDNGYASVGDGIAVSTGYQDTLSVGYGVAWCPHDGIATASNRGVAIVESGKACSDSVGIASVRFANGIAQSGKNGVAIGWLRDTASVDSGGVIILGYEASINHRVVYKLKAGQAKPIGRLEPNAWYVLDNRHEFKRVK
jgi:hypothetical protein